MLAKIGHVKRDLIDAYLIAKDTIIMHGYAAEIDWQESRCLALLTESEFLNEAAWVVLSSGMREAVIRQIFPKISQSFLNWGSAREIVLERDLCEARALKIFHHPRKISAIGAICCKVAETGFERYKLSIQTKGIDLLQELDFIGPITKYHLAKNIGLDVVKPDRHLVRLARATNFKDPIDLCQRISDITGDKVSVIDIVLWRYATLNLQYASFFQQ